MTNRRRHDRNTAIVFAVYGKSYASGGTHLQ